ncbi:MAG: hypothetical protein M3Q65_04900 [Chloroflexota bacterium]|nr:hypothetical protein [Chloroflexota bacterium]
MTDREALALALAAVAGFLLVLGVALLELLDQAGVLPLAGAVLCFALARAVSAHRGAGQRRWGRPHLWRRRAGPARSARVPLPLVSTHPA